MSQCYRCNNRFPHSDTSLVRDRQANNAVRLPVHRMPRTYVYRLLCFGVHYSADADTDPEAVDSSSSIFCRSDTV
jgi:hypothetical protein